MPRYYRQLQRVLIAWLIWELSLVMLSYTAGRVELRYQISRLSAVAFGPPADVYGVRNLILPGLIEMVLVSTPTVLLALLVYQRQARFRLLTVIMFITLAAILLALAAGDPTEAAVRPWKAIILALLIGSSTALLLWFLCPPAEELPNGRDRST